MEGACRVAWEISEQQSDSGMTGELSDWLRARPAWVAQAAFFLLETGSIEPQQFDELADLCEAELHPDFKHNAPQFEGHALLHERRTNLRLQSIGEIVGINALGPRRPLEFERAGKNVNMTVVYGHNGAGKSGYVRLLKHICGAKHQGRLLPNVFNPDGSPGSCIVEYSCDNTRRKQQWTVDSGVVEELSSIDIFDTSCGRAYLETSDEVSYEPRILQVFSALTTAGDRLSEMFERRSQTLYWKKDRLPADLRGTHAGEWYESVNHLTDPRELDELTDFNIERRRQEIKQLRAMPGAESAEAHVRELELRVKPLEALVHEFQEIARVFNAMQVQKLRSLHEARLKTGEAVQAAARLSEDADDPADIASDAWAELWRAARRYAASQSPADSVFPSVDAVSRCPLCRREYDAVSRDRVRAFDEFMRSAAQQQSAELQARYDAALADLQRLALDEGIAHRARAALDPISAEGARVAGQILCVYAELRSLRAYIAERRFDLIDGRYAAKTFKEFSACTGFVLSEMAAAVNRVQDYKRRVAGDEDGEARKRRLNELMATWFLHERRDDIRAGIELLKQKERLERARKLCRTAEISRKKAELIREIVEREFIGRFNEELEQLRAGHFGAEIVRENVKKGRVAWRLQLRDARGNAPTREVLSEGEQRMVELAAFLADVRGRPDKSTFVFDDPISSLDGRFEAAVVDRLLRLSTERQVIVFTHRLSLLSLFTEFAGRYAGLRVNVLNIRREAWGAGEPGSVPLSARSTKNLMSPLRDLVNKAGGIHRKEGFEAYLPHARYLCAEIRILIERMVENDLLGTIVERHRRAINTKDKLLDLTVINEEDCLLIERMMSRYSTFVHAQSFELPGELPLPEEFAADLATLSEWSENLKKRRNTLKKQTN